MFRENQNQKEKKPYYKPANNNKLANKNKEGDSNVQHKGNKRQQINQDNTFKQKEGQKNTSYSKLVEKCPFYEINQRTFYSYLLKQLAKKFLGGNKDTENINSILIRASNKESVTKLYKVYHTLRNRFVGVSTILHKCKTKMIYNEGRINKKQRLRKCIEVVFIKVPTDQQKHLKGFKYPKVQGEIIDYQQYISLYNFSQDAEKEQKEELIEEQSIADYIFQSSFLHSKSENLFSKINQNYDQKEVEEKDDEQEEEQKQQELSNYDESSQQSEDSEEDISSDEEQEMVIQKQNSQKKDLQITQLWKKLEGKVLNLNSHIKKISEDCVNFVCNYKLTQQAIAVKPEIVQQMENQSTQIMKKIEQKIQKNNVSLSNISPQDSKDILKGVLFKHLRSQGHQVQISEESDKQMNSAKLFQLQMVLTGQQDNLKYLNVSIEDSKELNYDQLIQDERKKEEFTQKFIDAASQQYQVSKDRIIIIGIQKGSVIVNHYVAQSTDQDIDNFLQKGKQQFEKVFKKVSIQVKSLIDQFEIRDDYFNEKYNMEWPEWHRNYVDYRGSLPRFDESKLIPQRYYFPVGYKGYGIDVSNWLKESSEWFGQTSKEEVWIVLYHGTGIEACQYISGSKGSEAYIKPGFRNVYGGDKCRLTGQLIKNGSKMNTYLSDLPEGQESSQQYCKPFKLGNKMYNLMFQCRVNPKHVRSPIGRPNYYTVEEKYAKQSIRPYRLLLKEQ